MKLFESVTLSYRIHITTGDEEGTRVFSKCCANLFFPLRTQSFANETATSKRTDPPEQTLYRLSFRLTLVCPPE